MEPGRDAEEQPLATHDSNRRPARYPDIWIRLAGHWHPAAIDHWLGSPTGWLIYVHHPGIQGLSGTDAGLYAYDVATIRPRMSTVPPDQWRTTASPDTIAALLRQPYGHRKYDQPLPSAPCCGAPVNEAWGDGEFVVCLPCGHRTEVGG